MKEVMLRDIDLPQEYAKGLEGLLAVADAGRMKFEAEVLKDNPACRSSRPAAAENCGC